MRRVTVLGRRARWSSRPSGCVGASTRVRRGTLSGRRRRRRPRGSRRPAAGQHHRDRDQRPAAGFVSRPQALRGGGPGRAAGVPRHPPGPPAAACRTRTDDLDWVREHGADYVVVSSPVSDRVPAAAGVLPVGGALLRGAGRAGDAGQDRSRPGRASAGPRSRCTSSDRPAASGPCRCRPVRESAGPTLTLSAHARALHLAGLLPPPLRSRPPGWASVRLHHEVGDEARRDRQPEVDEAVGEHHGDGGRRRHAEAHVQGDDDALDGPQTPGRRGQRADRRRRPRSPRRGSRSRYGSRRRGTWPTGRAGRRPRSRRRQRGGAKGAAVRRHAAHAGEEVVQPAVDVAVVHDFARA